MTVRSTLSVLIWYQNQVHTPHTFWDDHWHIRPEAFFSGSVILRNQPPSFILVFDMTGCRKYRTFLWKHVWKIVWNYMEVIEIILKYVRLNKEKTKTKKQTNKKLCLKAAAHLFYDAPQQNLSFHSFLLLNFFTSFHELTCQNMHEKIWHTQ